MDKSDHSIPTGNLLSKNKELLYYFFPSLIKDVSPDELKVELTRVDILPPKISQKFLKKAIGKVNKDYASHINTVDDAKEAVKQYTAALIQQAVVQRYQNELADKAVDLGKTQLLVGL